MVHSWPSKNLLFYILLFFLIKVYAVRIDEKKNTALLKLFD